MWLNNQHFNCFGTTGNKTKFPLNLWFVKTSDEQLMILLVNYLDIFTLLFTWCCTVAINSQIDIKNLHCCKLISELTFALWHICKQILIFPSSFSKPFSFDIVFVLLIIFFVFDQTILTCPLGLCVKYRHSDVWGRSEEIQHYNWMQLTIGKRKITIW